MKQWSSAARSVCPGRDRQTRPRGQAGESGGQALPAHRWWGNDRVPRRHEERRPEGRPVPRWGFQDQARARGAQRRRHPGPRPGRSAGSVTYKDKGTSGGCNYLGGGTRAFGPGEFISPDTITFDYLGKRYAGTAAVDSFFYSIDVNCQGSHGSQQGPLFSLNFFYTPTRPFPFGATQVTGGTPTQYQTWPWDFH